MPTRQQFRSRKRQVFHRLTGILLLLLLWQFISFFFSPMVVPPPFSVAVRLWKILNSPDLPNTLFTTLTRLLAGLLIGITAGTVIGLIFGIYPDIEEIFFPFINVLQSIPPVCWVVMALVWFGFNGRPCIFIVATASIPTMVINLSGGVRNIDPKLLEMAHLYHFSTAKTLRHIILPSVYPCFRMALEIIIGSSWKLVVMGEVLTTSTGIGGAITTARLNIEPDAIIAWAVLLTVFCFLTERLLKQVLCKKGDSYVKA